MKAYYNNKANEAAESAGVGKLGAHNGRRDAFRHAYASALVTYKYGEKVSKYTGDKVEEWGNNPETERWMDERNNKIGREIGQRIKKSGGSEEDIAKEVKKSLDSGELVRTPYDPRRTYEVHGDWDRAVKESKEALEQDRANEKKNLQDSQKLHDVNRRFDELDWDRKSEIKRQEKGDLLRQSPPPTTQGRQPPFLDGMNDALGAAGSALATAGSVTFDGAMSVGKDTLVHAVTQPAMQGGMGGKAALANAVKIATAQALSRMHGLVMQEVDRHHPAQPGHCRPNPPAQYPNPRSH